MLQPVAGCSQAYARVIGAMWLNSGRLDRIYLSAGLVDTIQSMTLFGIVKD
ncbi:MAG: hypothetical protein AAGF93_03440 [Cyanobacteria bacterium P01_H01_bin.105]